MNDLNNEPDRCHVCGKTLSSGWFAKLRRGEEWILLCSPGCSMRYYDSMRPEQERDTQAQAADEQPSRFLVHGEIW